MSSWAGLWNKNITIIRKAFIAVKVIDISKLLLERYNIKQVSDNQRKNTQSSQPNEKEDFRIFFVQDFFNVLSYC